MPSPRPLPPELAGRAFTVREASARGVSRGRTRSSDLSSPYRGIRAPAGNGSFDAALGACAARMPEHEFFSHVTAARIYGIPLPARLMTVDGLHVSVQSPRFPPRVRGVVAHRINAGPADRSFRGWRVVAPEIAWCQLAGLLGEHELVVAADYLLRRKHPLSDRARMSAAIDQCARARRALRRAIARAREGTDSPKETELRLAIVDAALPEPVVGHVITDRWGEFVAVPDLAYVRERIAIEYDGDVHRTDRFTYLSDIDRREAMEEAGWLVVRVVHSHLVTRRPWLIARLTRFLADRADI